MIVRLRAFEIRRVSAALLAVGSAMSLVAGSCSAPPPPPPPRVSYEQKVAWILRLEDQRVLRDPAPAPAPPPPPAKKSRRPAAAPLPDATADLTKLIADADPRVRRRAAIALGRVGIAEGVDALRPLLADPDVDVRQAAAFATGLSGDGRAVVALVPLLADAAKADAGYLAAGRAAEALGLIGERLATTDPSLRDGMAAPIGELVAGLARTEAVRAVAPDEIRYPLAPEVEAFRLGLYALARVKAYDQAARAVLDEQGQPRLRWWPVAYALQRIEDPRAVPALLTLLRGDGAYAAAFAARGLGKMKDARAVDPLLTAVAKDARPAVRFRAVEALGTLGDARAAAPLVALLDQPAASLDPGLRLAVVTSLGQLRAASANDRLLDLLSDPWPPMRVASARALALIDPVAFVTVLSGMDLDPEWSVRAGLVETLASLDWPTTVPRLVASLNDTDQRAIPAVLRALVRAKAPGVDKVLIDRLRNEEPVVRAAAARLLGEVKPAGAAAVLVAAYQAAVDDPSSDVREAILEALASLGAPEAREIATRALADRDWGTRLKASAVLKKLDPSAGADPVRPAPIRLDHAAYDALAVPTVSPHVFIDTSRGTIEIELAVTDAPLTTQHFMSLVKQGFYNGLLIHRVLGDFVVQGGDPRGDGTGGPGYSIRDELNDLPYLRGTVGMALDGPDTGGSQFFFTRSPQPHLDAKYTVFARIVSGIEVIDRLQQWDAIERIRVWDGVTMAPK